MKAPPPKKAGVFKRSAPDLPAEFDAAQGAPGLMDGESVEFQETHLRDLDART